MITSVVPKLPFIDKQATIDFYVRQLGFNMGNDYGDYFIVTLDAAELHFFSYPTLVPGKSDFMIYLRIDNGIEQLYEKWKKNDPPPERLGKLELKPWGQKEFPLIDPNGTLLTFGEGVRA
jgi:catechol 2,3-dioxygenase-like lactoylglutathione lyase family enzyme